jgi:hypothetical protein
VVELLDHSSTSVEAIGEINLIFSHIDRNMGGMAFPKDNFVFGDAFKTVLRSSGIEVE